MRVCRVCLTMSVKMYHMLEHRLSVMYERVTGVEINAEDKLPTMLCWECVARLSAANKFIEKASKAHLILMSKVEDSGFITMSDIESIDKTQYQLESTLGFKYYKENDSNFYTIKCDETNKNFYNEESQTKFHEPDVEMDDDSNNEKEYVFTTQVQESSNEKDPIKIEYFDINLLPKIENNCDDTPYNQGNFNHDNKDENKFLSPTLEMSIKKSESDEELTIDNANAFYKEEIFILDEDKKKRQYECLLKNQRREALPDCKEVKVVLEDIMLTANKDNKQNYHKHLKDKCTSAKDTDVLCHPPIKDENLLAEYENDFMKTLTIRKDIIKEPKSINPTSNVSDPGIASKTINLKTFSAKNNISFMHHDAESLEKPFICDICDRSFQIKTELIQHIQRHSELYNCMYCSYKTSFKRDLKLHINCKHTKSISFKCTHCSYVAFIKPLLQEHIKTKHSDNTSFHYCAHCSYKTCRKYNLSKHMIARHIKNMIFNCSYCSFKTHRQENLTAHVKTDHANNISFNCSHCSFKTYQRSYLRAHVKSKHPKKQIISCSYCSFETYSRIYIREHINSEHTKKISYNCTSCDFKTYRKSGLRAHVRYKHTKTVSHNCPDCSYTTRKRSHLASHINCKHTKTTVFQCSLCEFVSYQKSKLSLHIIAKHTDKKSFNCPHCSFKTYYKNNYDKHINGHMKNTILQCSLCNFETHEKWKLNAHFNTKHNKSISFNCSYCIFKTSHKGTLERHVNAKHTKSISFDCTLCNYKAYVKHHLRGHVKNKHT